MNTRADRRERRVESAVREVYAFRAPTLTEYTPEGRVAYEHFWKQFMAGLGVEPDRFPGRTLLDVGCGSCEKTAFYADWGARVTGIEMTPSILELGRLAVANRDVTLVQTSLFDFSVGAPFDIVVSDGVLHHTADTFAALQRCARLVKPGGLLVFGLMNVWGTFWWFKGARMITRLLGGSDFHRRARWGQALFGWTRSSQEHATGAAFFRSPDSWAYDWFGNPRWNAHSPAEIRRWLRQLGFTHVGSNPPLERKPDGGAAALMRMIAGDGPRLMSMAWLLSGQPNMVYVCARKMA